TITTRPYGHALDGSDTNSAGISSTFRMCTSRLERSTNPIPSSRTTRYGFCHPLNLLSAGYFAGSAMGMAPSPVSLRGVSSVGVGAGLEQATRAPSSMRPARNAWRRIHLFGPPSAARQSANQLGTGFRLMLETAFGTIVRKIVRKIIRRIVRTKVRTSARSNGFLRSPLSLHGVLAVEYRFECRPRLLRQMIARGIVRK